MTGRKTLKQILIGVLSGVLILAACAQRETVTPVAVTQQPTVTPSSTPTGTYTFIPTATPTASITPLPTIPTFTPTFDASTIVTVTPAPKAECPQIDTSIKPEQYFPETLDYSSFSSAADKISEYLNQGGSGQLLFERLKTIYPEVESTGGYDFRDVTGDQVPEFLYIEFYFEGKLVIFSCADNRFEQIAVLSGDHADHAYSLEIEDLNMDGVAEVILIGAFCGSFCHDSVYLYASKGQNFTLVSKARLSPMRQIIIKDLDRNGTKEIMLSGGDPSCLSCSNLVPQRQRTVIHGWNGKTLVEVSNEFEFPEYRFQAVQDADALAVGGEYESAFELYEEAILNTRLEWWSPERMEYTQALHMSWIPDLTLPPEPSEDKAEYPRLAAYVYYRMMLLHIVQGNEVEAGTTYKTLQEELGNNEYSQLYVAMATDFWDAYQSTHKMYDGCAAAIQYAVEHPEILIPLGSDYHGSQSHTYVPADVCPFR
jgi:tetratricopeptide (TPR) repeat protein